MNFAVSQPRKAKLFINVYNDYTLGGFWHTRKSADKAKLRHKEAHGMPCVYRIVATERRSGVFDEPVRESQLLPRFKIWRDNPGEKS